MKFLILFFMFIFSFSYDLIVTSKKDVTKLSDIGFVCQKKNSVYVCLSSNDLNELRRIKDFLKEKFHIKTQIVADVKTSPVKKSKIKRKTTSISTNLVKSGYCIQVGSFSTLKNAKSAYEYYKKFPFTRIEKIGSFYTVRVGEGSLDEIRNLRSQVRGIIKRCDIIPERILISNFEISNIKSVKIPSVSKSKVKGNLKAMYYYLNNGDLVKAKEEALKLKSIYPEDANLVLGIIAMKNQDFKKACSIFSSLNVKKAKNLKRDACFTYYLKQGFNVLNDSPKEALYFFNKALKYKNDINALIGKGYAYLNSGEYEKAYKIFKSLYEKYPNNEKIAEGYINTLYMLKKFDELERVKNSLSPILKAKLKSLDFYVKLKQAQDLIKKGEYKKAQKILTDLYLQKPDDVNVLLTLGNLYLQTNRLDEALSFYKNVLLISPNNIYALKALEAIYLKKGDYKKALEYSDKITSLGFTDENRAQIEKLYYISLAKRYLKKNNLEKAKEYLKKAREIDPNDALILAMLGDIALKEHKNNLAYMYYAKAYSLKPNDFGITLKFLYALLNLNLYDQIKIILSKIDTSLLNETQKAKLRRFYIDLYAKYSAYLLNNGEYRKALDIVNDGLLMESDNFNLLSNKAWICLRLKKYECAKKYFKLALEKKSDNNLKYGLALVYLNLGDKREAKRILDSIHTNDKKLRVKIAGAYVRLGDIDKAKEILKGVNPTIEVKEEPTTNINIEEPSDKDYFPNPFLKDIKPKNDIFLGENKKKIEDFAVKKKIVLKDVNFSKEYEEIKQEIAKIEQNYIANLEVGVKLRNKNGEEGISKLERVSFPYIKGEYFIKNKKIYFVVDGEYLYSGDGNVTLKNNANGIVLKGGFEGENLKVEISSTPLGTNLVSPTITGFIAYKLKKEFNTYYLEVYRKSIKDTITSFVGNIYVDEYKKSHKFSRVVNNGIKFGYKRDLDSNGSFLYTNLSLGYIKGENTSSNVNIEGELLYLFNIGNIFLDKDFLGFYLDITHFEKNNYKFYLPYGGYFSPRLLFLFMPRYEGYFYSKDKRFISKLVAMVGGSYLDNYNSKGINFSYDIGYNLKYLLLNRLALESGIDYRNSRDYNDLFFTLMFRYYFGNKMYFKLKEIDEFSKKVINW